MLSLPDTRLAERQSLLPGLATVLDGSEIVERAREHGMNLPDDCEPGYIRFKPSTSCLVGYRHPGKIEPPIFYATAFSRDSRKLAKAVRRHLWPSQFGAGRITLNDSAIEVCAFPNDDHLKGVGELVTPEFGFRMTRCLLRGHAKISDPQLTTLAYKPERRCVFRIDEGQTPVAAVKAYGRRGFSDALHRALVVQANRAVVFPRLIGHSAKRSLISLEWFNGRTLAEILRDPEPDFDCVAGAGELLARFHAQGLGSLPLLDAQAIIGRLSEIAATVKLLHPEVGNEAEELLAKIEKRFRTVPESSGTIHGDFYVKQVLVSRGSIKFLDTDECAIGPTFLDIGNFLAHTEMRSLRGEFSIEVAATSRAAFLDGYRSHASLPSATTINFWTAVSLLNVAHEPFRNHRPEWPDQIEGLLRRIREVLES